VNDLALFLQTSTHGIADMARDVLVAVIAGLFVPLVLSYRARRRDIARGLNRAWTELRHTQKSVIPPVEPFYSDSGEIDSLTKE